MKLWIVRNNQSLYFNCFQNVLVIVLTFKSASGVWFNVAGWVLAVKDCENVPYLLHTYRTSMYSAIIMTKFNKKYIDKLFLVVKSHWPSKHTLAWTKD